MYCTAYVFVNEIRLGDEHQEDELIMAYGGMSLGRELPGEADVHEKV